MLQIKLVTRRTAMISASSLAGQEDLIKIRTANAEDRGFSRDSLMAEPSFTSEWELR